MANWYDLIGAFLCSDATDSALEAPLRPYLEGLGTAPRDEPPAFTFIIERGTPGDAPEKARLLFQGPLPEGPDCRMSADGDRRWFVIPDRLSLEYSIPGSIARFCVAPGHEALVGRTAAIHAIYAALYSVGQTLVHAAALRLPRRRDAFVLFAPSGAGKTTTSLALALQGFGLITDDAAILTGTGGSHRIDVWGLPRSPKVHQRTAEMLPAIGRLLGSSWNADGEQSLSREALRSVVELLPAQSYPLAALVLLGKRVAGAHIFRPMRKADLFVHFANDNVSRSPLGVLNDDLARYHRFVGMVTAMPAYELNVGSDISTLGQTIAAALEPADQPILSA